ncbi:MAG: hypothetical protein KDE33_11640 [Bacteroidetes bacterium]|nr:hypothetical protein [Bacteroidota bacterium]MCB9226101.1 hypothetical protein [Chitinophagales bacterium]
MRYLFSVISLFILLTACNKNKDDKKTLACGDVVNIDADKYQSDSSSYFLIDTAFINQNCLTITIGASGCDGSTWQTVLYDEGVVMDSYPIQRNIRFVLKNEELCLAVFSKTYSFDLQPTQGTENKISFNLEGWNNALLYEY